MSVLDPQRLVRTTYPEGKAVTPSNSTDLGEVAHGGLYVIATGNVVFDDALGNTITLTSVPAFTRIPIAARRVRATGTTATVLALN